MTRRNDSDRLRSPAAEARFPPRLRGSLAITHVDVITMDSPELLRNHTVVIEAGVIRALAPSAALDVSGMRVIDGSNRYLMPGLADMHTHLTDPGVCSLYLANGVTRLRNMDGRPWHLALAKQIEQGELPGPRLLSVSPLIDGLGEQGLTARPYSLVLTDPTQAEAVVRKVVARGYSEVKAYQWLSLDVLRALGAAAARAGVRMAGHCPDGLTFEQSIAAGMGCFEHLTNIANGHLLEGPHRNVVARRGTREALELVARHLDFDAIRRLAQTMAAQEIWNCPTLVVWQKQLQSPEQALADPDLQYEHRGAVREWEKMIRARFAALPCPADEWLALGRGRDAALAKVVSILREEGAPLLLGTDAPNPFVIHGCSIHHELANLLRAGLSPYEALRCGTTEAARFLGESATTGSVAVGKSADLLLLRANPLVDIGVLRSGLESVFVNGYCLTRPDLDAMLAAYVTALAAPPSEHLPSEHLSDTVPASEHLPSEHLSDAAPASEHLAAEHLPDAAPASEHPSSKHLSDTAPQSAPRSKSGDTGRAAGSRQGSFQEWTGDTHVGRASYRHSKLPDGGWQVEERSARSGPRGPQRCTSRLWLGADWTVRRARIKTDTDVGTERSDIDWSDGAYHVRVTQPDGYTSESTVTSPPLLPSERLAFSVLPMWSASQTAPVTAPSLSIEHEVAQVATVIAEQTAANAATTSAATPNAAEANAAEANAAAEARGSREVSWQLRVKHPGEVATQTYRISQDGALVSLQGVLFSAPHRLIAEPAENHRIARPTTGT